MKATIHQSNLEVVRGDISQQDTEAIGNAANSALLSSDNQTTGNILEYRVWQTPSN
jgi:O-acetyl-ADP-ribose deacetylase (regulator of RNase III)